MKIVKSTVLVFFLFSIYIHRMFSLNRHFKFYFLGFLFAATFFVWYAVFARGDQRLTVAFLNVGQGDAILISTPDDQQILIDGGPDSAVLSGLSRVMPFYDRSIDVVVATHPDMDHIGGLIDVLERYNVEFVIDPGAKSDTAVYGGLEKTIAKKGIKKILARRGMKVVLQNGAYLLILFPDRDVADMDSNDASIVAKLVYGDTSFLLTGDSPKKIEHYLASIDPNSLNVDVLKAGHHGSRTSSSEEFIRQASPEYAIISAGLNNHYGHPHREVVTLLEKFGVNTLRTDLLGSIIFKSDGENIFVE